VGKEVVGSRTVLGKLGGVVAKEPGLTEHPRGGKVGDDAGGRGGHKYRFDDLYWVHCPLVGQVEGKPRDYNFPKIINDSSRKVDRDFAVLVVESSNSFELFQEIETSLFGKARRPGPK
jgi:hypothetical protein